MKIIKTKIFGINKFFHGIISAKKYFKGKFIREVFITIYDSKINKSSRAYMFITEGNVLIFSFRFLDKKGVLIEL